MKSNIIELHELKPYIEEAFLGDEELLGFYDKSVPVTRVQDICDNVFLKISSLLQPAMIRGIEIEGEKVGYIAFNPGILISFGLKKEYRDKEHLIQYWELIRKELNGDFQCALFGQNVRGISWLMTCGMDILFENITLLNYASSK
jgi:hypothetical protein